MRVSERVAAMHNFRLSEDLTHMPLKLRRPERPSTD